jgi:hypothetical protein
VYEWQIIRISGQKYSSVRAIVDIENRLVKEIG